MLKERIATRHNVVALGPFTVDALAASASNQQAGGDDGVVAPWAGSVIGMSGVLSAAASAGELTVGASADGAENANSTVTVTTETVFSARFDAGRIPFAADEQLGVEFSTDGDWDSTGSLKVTLFVIFENMDF